MPLHDTSRAWRKPDSGLSLVVEDQARSSARSACTADHLAALRRHLLDDLLHGEQVLTPRASVIQGCRDLHLELQKTLRRRVCRAQAWSENSLPYIDNTVKSKCFDTFPSDSGRTCRKQGHSCLRKIISWDQHPGRAFFQTRFTCWRDPSASPPSAVGEKPSR